jgi:hypothetical protein
VARRMSMASMRESLALAGHALRAWTTRQYLVALGVAAGFALIVGFVTVLIPNSVFMRDIDTVWWNYPVWVLTSLGAGMLTATYVTPRGREKQSSEDDRPEDQKPARMGIIGGVLTWFAVGCPVCNKIALLALGYSGAITWFAPFQPVLAIAAMILTGLALIVRLKGQMACPVTLPVSQAADPKAQPQSTV